jgi:dTDP-4-amino-4,6-dideoxygalactose transaminase
MPDRIKFNVPTLVGREFAYLREALETGHISGNGRFSKRCQVLISDVVGGGFTLLTHSCTGALEMAAILSEIELGDEVILPSFTFTSTANAFVLRGGIPVFVDIRPDTLNLDEALIEQAITPRTKAICVVHYAGVACEMDRIMEVAAAHGLRVIEDAAQALHASYKGQPLGSFGDFAALSFHETKNIISGEGGALVVNDRRAIQRAEVVWEKGTNRAQFYRGEISKYTWTDVGSSFLPSELTAAFLLAQLEEGERITTDRKRAWEFYHENLGDLESERRLRRPMVPEGCCHNAHIYYILVEDAARRDEVIRRMAERNVSAVIHYVPLHSAPAGRKFGRTSGSMRVTDDVSARLIRLPLHPQIKRDEQMAVVAAIREAIG